MGDFFQISRGLALKKLMNSIKLKSVSDLENMIWITFFAQSLAYNVTN